MTTIPSYPLSWPEGLPRTERKASSQFKTGLSAALKNVRGSLELFGKDSGRAVTNVAITSNVTLGSERPADSGIAVWFEWDGQQRCIAVDRYPKPEDNLQAVHHVLEARRTEMRHGGLHVVRQTFKGFTALPAPPGWKSFREVFGFPPGVTLTTVMVDSRYRELAATAHPDKPSGSEAAMAELNRARREAKEALQS
jgi:hypothetical protein